jgi:hypothetical protein
MIGKRTTSSFRCITGERCEPVFVPPHYQEDCVSSVSFYLPSLTDHLIFYFRPFHLAGHKLTAPAGIHSHTHFSLTSFPFHTLNATYLSPTKFHAMPSLLLAKHVRYALSRQ